MRSSWFSYRSYGTWTDLLAHACKHVAAYGALRLSLESV